MASTNITSTDQVLITSTDGVNTDSIEFSASDITRISDSKKVLFEGDALPDIPYSEFQMNIESYELNYKSASIPAY